MIQTFAVKRLSRLAAYPIVCECKRRIGCEKEDEHRITAAWQKSKELAGVLCDLKLLVWVKGKVNEFG